MTHKKQSNTEFMRKETGRINASMKKKTKSINKFMEKATKKMYKN
jgi:hypothetical protein